MVIPYGTKYTAFSRGTKRNEVECENCGGVFLYEVKRITSASETSFLWLDTPGAKKRSKEAAQYALNEALCDAIDLVACPCCGWFQSKMCDSLNWQRAGIILGVAITIATLLSLGGLYVAGMGVGLLGFMGAAFGKPFYGPNRGHAGRGSVDPKRAANSRGVDKAELELAYLTAKNRWEEKFHSYLLQSMILISASDGMIDESELEVVSNIYKQVTGDEISAEELKSKAVGLTKTELLRNLRRFCDDLTDEAKDLYIRAGVAVAAADGEFKRSEVHFLTEMAKTMEVNPERFEVLLNDIKA